MNRIIALSAAIAATSTGMALAAPYASSVSVSGTAVSFVLNEGGSNLSYSINGGAPIALDGTSKGTKSFVLGSATDTFSITASKASAGYAFTNGTTTATATNGLSQTTNNGGFQLVSSDNNTLGRFNNPRGVSVNNNPNAGALFGTSYVANSGAGTIAANTGLGTAARTIGDGLYALKGDGSDAFGYGDTAHPTTAEGAPSTWSASTSAPYRVSVGADNNVYVADFADASSVVGFATPTLNGFSQVLAGVGGAFPIANTQNHGSTTAIGATGSIATGNLVVYTLDEDITAVQAGGTGAGRNNLLRYNIGAGPLNSTVTPVKVNQTPILLDLANSDFEFGADGKIYVGQNRGTGNDGAGVTVLASDGSVLFDSLSASRTLLGSTTANDILRNVQGLAVSPDEKFIALMLNDSDVAVVPLVNGIPDIANRTLVDTGTDVNSGRDIAFDAADNIYYVSSGQALYRVLSPGGIQTSTLSYNGTNFSFSNSVVAPEPATLTAVLGLGGLVARRRRSR